MSCSPSVVKPEPEEVTVTVGDLEDRVILVFGCSLKLLRMSTYQAPSARGTAAFPRRGAGARPAGERAMKLSCVLSLLLFSTSAWALPPPAQVYDSAEVPRTIQDGVTIYSGLNVADTSIVVDVNVTITATHPSTGGLEITLRAPWGEPLDLSSGNGGDSDFTTTTFDDEAAQSVVGAGSIAGTFRPERPLSILDGHAANGLWTILIKDDGRWQYPSVGTLRSWSLAMTTGSGQVPQACVPDPGKSLPLTLSWDNPPEEIWGNRLYVKHSGDPWGGAVADLPRQLECDPDRLPSNVGRCAWTQRTSLPLARHVIASPGPTLYEIAVTAYDLGGESGLSAPLTVCLDDFCEPGEQCWPGREPW